MGMSAGGGDGKNVTPSVNVTPLVDVCLVVLIIFMVVTPMMVKAFALKLPPKPDDQAVVDRKDKKPPVFMMVEPDGKILINSKVYARAQLPQELPAMLAAQDVPVLFFNAKDGTPYGTAVEVMDLARAAGARNIAIVTKDAP